MVSTKNHLLVETASGFFVRFTDTVISIDRYEQTDYYTIRRKVMVNTIDVALIKQLDKAIELYANDDVETGITRASIIALLTDYSSRLSDINLLIENHRLSSCKVLMRVAFETDVYLRYIFERNNRMENRAKAYFYHGFQKTAYYFQHLSETDIADPNEIIQDINNSNNPKLLGHYHSVNEYFNDKRTVFRSCFNIENRGLSFQTLTDDEPFRPFKIDSWKWYNDDGNTRNFLLLVRRLNLLNDYAALYVPTSGDVHSDILPHDLEASPHTIKVVQSFDPNMLVFFRISILEFLQFIRSHIHNNDNRRKVTKLIKSAKTIYFVNNR